MAFRWCLYVFIFKKARVALAFRARPGLAGSDLVRRPFLPFYSVSDDLRQGQQESKFKENTALTNGWPIFRTKSGKSFSRRHHCRPGMGCHFFLANCMQFGHLLTCWRPFPCSTPSSVQNLQLSTYHSHIVLYLYFTNYLKSLWSMAVGRMTRKCQRMPQFWVEIKIYGHH